MASAHTRTRRLHAPSFVHLQQILGKRLITTKSTLLMEIFLQYPENSSSPMTTTNTVQRLFPYQVSHHCRQHYERVPVIASGANNCVFATRWQIFIECSSRQQTNFLPSSNAYGPLLLSTCLTIYTASSSSFFTVKALAFSFTVHSTALRQVSGRRNLQPAFPQPARPPLDLSYPALSSRASKLNLLGYRNIKPCNQFTHGQQITAPLTTLPPKFTTISSLTKSHSSTAMNAPRSL